MELFIKIKPDYILGFAHLFAVKLCFTEAAPILLEAMPPSGGVSRKSYLAAAGKVELFRK